MDPELAKEIQEATNELLDLAPFGAARQAPKPSPPTKTVKIPPLPRFSSSSKLELIPSPTDIRPSGWLTSPRSDSQGNASTPSNSTGQHAAQQIKLQIGASIWQDDDDDKLPARGLSSRMHSVKALELSHIETSPTLIADQGDSDESSPSTHDSAELNRSPTRNEASASRLRITTPVNDVFINEYGERVVNGKVVGKILGGRPRSAQATDRRTIAVNGPSSKDKPPSTQSEGFKSAPAFFLQSFPDAFSGSSQPIDRGSSDRVESTMPKLQTPRAITRSLVLNQEEEPDYFDETSFHTADGDRVNSASVSPEVEGITRRPKRLDINNDLSLTDSKQALKPSTSPAPRDKIELPSLRNPTPTIELSQAATDHVILHGNKRQARASGLVQPTGSASSGPTPNSSLGKKVEQLFTTPLVSARPEHGDEEAWSIFQSRGVISASVPCSPTFSSAGSNKIGDGDDDDKASLESAPSSLLSLPVSTLTGSSHANSHMSGSSSIERRRSGGRSSRRRSSARRSDVSQYPSEIFAREVRIRGWNEVGSQARGWVVFEIRIVTKQGTTMTALKRFSSFVKLRQNLISECPDQAKWLPSLPSRTTGLLHKYDAHHLEKRRKDLQTWLEKVMLDRVWGCSECLREWILGGE